ncbi:PKD domain-containing protein [Geodermatophilus sabuli]|uniref:PKD domain-containing protein n=1 Tax=Geodermatophilus sabuli TaxID=1564158 RepID=A0A7K3W0P2_9ACTN|nr:PQQ-dependent sugar dehydrogenase [Geodermatophilus sabuli]NEK57744.1 PKD domain-containing protein [Geodermatophilus sabuli]
MRRLGSGLRTVRWRLRGRPLTVCLLAALAVGLGAVSPAPAQAAPVLPPGFVVQELPTGQAELLTDVAPAPDGSWFTTGKNGRVAWVSADGRTTTLAELPVVSVQDLGLTGLAVAADHATSRTVYTARTLDVDGAWTMRVSAWTVVGEPEPVRLEAERVLWDLRADADVHATTGLVAAPDGTLWVTIGDAADFRVVDPLALRALDVDQGHGKLLHVAADGAGLPTNPFYDAGDPYSWRSRVYASGFRSPFRVGLDPTTGTPVVGDVGWNGWEEVDLVRPGAGYGWPCWEGGSPTPGYADLAGCAGVPNTAPLWAYPHGSLGTAVTGGVVYTGTQYPAEYQGAYFFGDFTSQRVYTLRYDDQGGLVREPEAGGFATEAGTPVRFTAAPNGDVVYGDLTGNRLVRLVYAPGNRPPTAEAAVTTDPATRTVTLDAGGSTDPDGDPLTHTWDLGDGATAAGTLVTHQYAEPGTAPVTARLTVSDPAGAQATAEVTVVPADQAPVLQLTAPPAEQRFAVGDPVRASATATDPEDGDLEVTWSQVLVHCSGGYCHEHPGESSTGPLFERPFEDHGDATHLEVTASAVDGAGVRREATFVAQPRLRTLTVTTDVPSPITVNGVARAGAELVVGARVSVIAPAVASDGRAAFAGWADGMPRERELVMPDADLTLSATYAATADPAALAAAP